MSKLELTRVMRRQRRSDRIGLVLALLMLVAGILSVTAWLG